MFTIKTKEGVLKEYKNINHACKENGSTASGYNRQNAMRFLKNLNLFDMSTAFDDTEQRRHAKTVEAVVKETVDIDGSQIEKLNQELLVLAKSPTGETLVKMQEVNAKIEALQNPVLTVENLQKVFTEFIEDYAKHNGLVINKKGELVEAPKTEEPKPEPKPTTKK